MFAGNVQPGILFETKLQWQQVDYKHNLLCKKPQTHLREKTKKHPIPVVAMYTLTLT